MPNFKVTLRDIKKPSVTKDVVVEAMSKEAAMKKAEKEGYKVASVKTLADVAKKEVAKLMNLKDQLKFFRGTSSMLKANISTAESIAYYAQGLSDQNLQNTLMRIRERLDSGQPIHLAMARENIFDNMTITIINAGADAGQLFAAFTSLAKSIKMSMMINGKLKKAIAIPTCVILFNIVMFTVGMTVIVPQVEGNVNSLGTAPDSVSAVIFGVSHFVQNIWYLVFIAIAIFFFTIFNSGNFRNNCLNLMMKYWKALRVLVMNLRQTAYISTLNLLYSNGVSLAKSSTLAAKTLEGTPIYEGFVAANKAYAEAGIPFADSLQRYSALDPQVTHMLGIGEKSASLPQQLELLREIYEEDTLVYLDDFTQVVNLIALASASFIIAVVFSSVMLPIFMMASSMMNQMSGR